MLALDFSQPSVSYLTHVVALWWAQELAAWLHTVRQPNWNYLMELRVGKYYCQPTNAAAAPACLFVAALDTFVDYTWRDLTGLSLTIVLLLVGEVRQGRAASR